MSAKGSSVAQLKVVPGHFSLVPHTVHQHVWIPHIDLDGLRGRLSKVSQSPEVSDPMGDGSFGFSVPDGRFVPMRGYSPDGSMSPKGPQIKV